MTDLPPEAIDEATDEATDEAAESAVEHARDEDELLRDDLDDLAREQVAEQGSAVQTGHPAVDEVLRSLDALDSEPVDAHVAVFEQAHEQLRRTLSGAGDDQD